MRNVLSPLLVFLLSSLAASAQVIVGSEAATSPLTGSNAELSVPRPAAVTARDRAGAAMAWSARGDDGSERIVVTRLDRNGAAVGPQRVIAAASPADDDALYPSLAALSDGDGFVLTWLEERRSSPLPASIAMYCVFDPALQPSAPRVLTGMAGPIAPPIVRSGSSTWISAAGLLWKVQPDGSISAITPSGLSPVTDMTAGDRPQLIGGARVQGPAYSCAPRPECHDWISFYGPICTLGPGCRDYTQSYKLTFIGRSPQSASFSFGSDNLPAIESDGRDTLVAWFDGTQLLGGNVVVTRLDSSERFLEATQSPQHIGSFSGDVAPSAIDVATDGARYLAVWQTISADGNHDIVAASLDREGRVTPVSIATTAADEREPSVTTLGGGTFLIAYEKIESGERHIGVRIVSFGARRRAVW